MSASPDAALGIGPDTCIARCAADAAQAASSLLLRLRAEGSALAQEADSRSPRVRHRSGGMAAAFNTGGHPSHGVSRLQWRAAGDVALRRAGSRGAARWLPPSTHGRHALRASGGRHPFRPVVQGRSRRPRGQGSNPTSRVGITWRGGVPLVERILFWNEAAEPTLLGPAYPEGIITSRAFFGPAVMYLPQKSMPMRVM